MVYHSFDSQKVSLKFTPFIQSHPFSHWVCLAHGAIKVFYYLTDSLELHELQGY